MIKKVLLVLWAIATIFFVLLSKIQASEAERQATKAMENLQLAEENAEMARIAQIEADKQAMRAEELKLQLLECQNQ